MIHFSILEDFEKSVCSVVVEGLTSKLLTRKTYGKTNDNFGAKVLTSLLVCSYMKTFENQDTSGFLMSIRRYAESCNYSVPKYPHNGGTNNVIMNMIMSSDWMTPCNKPLIELMYGHPIKKLNEVLLLVGNSNYLLA